MTDENLTPEQIEAIKEYQQKFEAKTFDPQDSASRFEEKYEEAKQLLEEGKNPLTGEDISSPANKELLLQALERIKVEREGVSANSQKEEWLSRISNVGQLSQEFINDGRFTEQDKRTFTTLVQGLYKLNRLLELLRESEDQRYDYLSSPGKLDSESENKINQLVAEINSGLQEFEFYQDYPGEEEIKNLYKRLLSELNILRGTETEEQEWLFENEELNNWLSSNHLELAEKITNFWQQHTSRGPESFSDTEREELDRLQTSVIDILSNLKDSESDEKNTDYHLRVMALTTLLNKVNQINEAISSIADQDSAPVTDRGLVLTPELKKWIEESKVEEYAEILTKPLDELLVNIVTNDFPRGDVQKWKQAVEKRAELMKQRGGEMVYMADFLIEAMTLYSLKFWVKDKTIDIDHISIIWEGAKEGLDEGAAIKSYSRFRANPLYQPIIMKLYDKGREKMDDKDDPWFSSGKDWNKGRDLFPACHKDLYSNDAHYKLAIDNIVSLVGEDNRESIVNFLANMTLYEACICDLRTNLATKEYGLSRKAFKHKKGVFSGQEGDAPQILLAKMSYKIGKNVDRGIYASTLGWIDMPKDLLRGGDRIDPPELRDSQEERFWEREEIISLYIKYVFGKTEALELLRNIQWRPVDMWSGMPQIEDFMHWHDYQDIDGDGEAEYVAEDATTAHYNEAWDALSKMYEKASKSWTTDRSQEFSQMSDIDLRSSLTEAVTGMGTQAARSLALILSIPIKEEPDFENKLKMQNYQTHMFEFVRASYSFYIMYLFAQLKPRTHGFKGKLPLVNRDYYQRMYKSAVEAMSTYFEQNPSLIKSYINPLWLADEAAMKIFYGNGGESIRDNSIFTPQWFADNDPSTSLSDYEQKFNERGSFKTDLHRELLKVVKSDALQKSTKVFRQEERVVYNTMLTKIQGGNTWSLTSEQLRKPVKWPYEQSSNRSVHEE